MAKPTRFQPKKTASGSWRLNIPAKHSETGQRQQLFYRTKDLAETAAAKLRKERDTFGHQAVAIAPAIAEQAVAAIRLLEPLGFGLLDAVSRFVEIETRQRASVPIADAVKAFRASGDATWSRSQSTAYRLRGEKLIEAFGERLISTITGEELQKHLNESTGGFNQSVRLVKAIWNWCARPPRKWCDTEAIQHLDMQSTVSGEIGVLTPKQAQALMDAAAKYFPETVPPLAIQLFTGLRKAELERLTPSDFNDEGFSVPAISAKTKRRRFVQMPEPLAAWLKAYPITDCVCPPDWQRKQIAVRRLAGFKVWSNLVPRLKIKPPLEATPPDDLPEWPENGLRHTAATVALALGKPLEQLVFEHGHTGGLEMLRKHYIGAMPKKDALAIWAIRPDVAKGKSTKKSNLRIA
jgi:integrase